MITLVLAILALITFLISIPLWEFSATKYFLQGLSVSLLIGAIVTAIHTHTS